MNSHFTLRSASAAVATAAPEPFHSEAFEAAAVKELARRLKFTTIGHSDMPAIWEILRHAPGRTTDFSYAGLLMWVDYFHYEYAIVADTLFIKGRVESDISKVAFSLPVGRLPLSTSIEILRQYCESNGLELELSAVPECVLPQFLQLSPRSVEPLDDWSDYLYDAESLATLKGKKYGKKRNHVNQFLAAYPGYSFVELKPEMVDDVMRFMDVIDAEGDSTPMAVAERRLNRRVLEMIAEGDDVMHGGVLRDADGHILGFTIGDVKGDTLFVHIEKASRAVAGGFEMLNKSFAEYMCNRYPEIRYINREDDAGDPGLRHAKESYHPVELLRKLNIIL